MSLDWRTPIKAQHEETYWLSPFGDLDRGNRWFCDADGFERIRLGMACPHCLTPFPAPVGKQFEVFWERSDFRFAHGPQEGMRLVRDGMCPICKCEATSEAMATQITQPHVAGEEIKDPVKE